MRASRQPAVRQVQHGQRRMSCVNRRAQAAGVMSLPSHMLRWCTRVTPTSGKMNGQVLVMHTAVTLLPSFAPSDPWSISHQVCVATTSPACLAFWFCALQNHQGCHCSRDPKRVGAHGRGVDCRSQDSLSHFICILLAVKMTSPSSLCPLLSILLVSSLGLQMDRIRQ